MLSHEVQPSCSAPKSWSISIQLPLSSPFSARAAGLWCPACVRAVGTPQVSGNQFSPLLYHTQTPSSAAFVGIVTISWLGFHSMFVLATAQIKKDRATSQIWWNRGWKMVVGYFPQGNLGEKWGKKQKAESLIFTPAFSLRYSIVAWCPGRAVQLHLAEPTGILLQVGAPSTTAEGLLGVRMMGNHP